MITGQLSIVGIGWEARKANAPIVREMAINDAPISGISAIHALIWFPSIL